MAEQAHGPPAPPLGPMPPMAPLPWSNRRGTVLAICITLTTVCWLTTMARLWTRFYVVRKAWWDDLFVTLAVVAFTFSTVIACVATDFGLGKNVSQVSLEDLKKVILCQYMWGISYTSSTALIKISLLLQYLRIFEKGTWTYRLTQALLVLVSLWGFAFVFISIFSCFPDPSAFWRMTYKGCYGFASPDWKILTNMIKGHAAANFFLDLLVFTLAIRLQFLNDAPSTRGSMILLLFVGLLACSFALWRLIDVAETGAGAGMNPTRNEPGPILLSTAEIYLAASCATIPFFWPAMRDQFNKIFVKYEFNVSSESHLPEDELELANTGSVSAGSGRDGARSLESESGINSAGKALQPAHTDIFSREQAASFNGRRHFFSSSTSSTVVSDRLPLRM